MAVLALVGGVDSRPRLGGLVSHEDMGTGTIARIRPNGKIHIQFEVNKVCRLTELVPVSSFSATLWFAYIKFIHVVPECWVHVFLHTRCIKREGEFTWYL